MQTVIFWTADWLSLDREAQRQIGVIAKRNPGVAFLRCSIDAHTVSSLPLQLQQAPQGVLNLEWQKGLAQYLHTSDL